MKNLNKKGFTLIELLAVIVIMGILMFVAIPAVSRTIENSRKDTFKDTARQYANQVKTLWAADGLECGTDPAALSASTTLADGVYIVPFESDLTSYNTVTYNSKDFDIPTLLESGGKSSWGNSDVSGVVVVKMSSGKATYKVVMLDRSGRGIYSFTDPDSLKRGDVKVSGGSFGSAYEGVTATKDSNNRVSVSGTTIKGYCEEV